MGQVKRYKTLGQYRLQCINFRSPYYCNPNSVRDSSLFSCSIPSNWKLVSTGFWQCYFPPAINMRDQGWKIHISSVPSQVENLLNVTAKFLFKENIAFKHIASKTLFLRSIAKYAPRPASGKFLVIYPQSDRDIERLLPKLELLLAGFDGSYILSDVKYASAPIFLRYGGFKLQGSREDKTQIQNNLGELIEDKREARFILPSFVEVPKIIEKQVAARLHPDKSQASRLFDKYEVIKCLHRSNAGGVYLAKVKGTDELVVIKEGRRFVSFTDESRDAFNSLKEEAQILKELQDLNEIPRFRDSFEIEDHYFLVEEYRRGLTLQSWVAENYPNSIRSEKYQKYEAKALALAKSIYNLVKNVHEYGYSLLDISLNNFLVTNENEISLIDFESFRKGLSGHSEALGTLGFIPQVKVENRLRDNYALCAMIFYLFYPSWVTGFHPRALDNSLRKIKETASESVIDFCQELYNKLDKKVFRSVFPFQPAEISNLSIRDLIDAFVSGIEYSKHSDDEKERTYPGDASQFLQGLSGFLNVETGSAGIVAMKEKAVLNCSLEAYEILDRLRDRPELLIENFHGLIRGSVGILACLAEGGHI